MAMAAMNGVRAFGLLAWGRLGLEEEADGHLHLAFGGEAGSGDAAEVAVARVAARVGELRGVGDVVDLGAELCAEAIGEVEGFEKRDVAGGEAGAVERVAGDIALGSGGGLREIAGEVLAADAVRLEDRTGDVGAEAVGAAVGRVDDREGRACLSRDDGVHLPAADDEVEAAVHIGAEHAAATDGEVGQGADDEVVTNVERRVALVEAAVVGVEGADGVEAEVAVCIVDVARPGVGRGEREALGGAIVELRLEAVVAGDAVVYVVDDLAERGEGVELVGGGTERLGVVVIAAGKMRSLVADIADGEDAARAHLLLDLEVVLLDRGGLLGAVDDEDVDAGRGYGGVEVGVPGLGQSLCGDRGFH